MTQSFLSVFVANCDTFAKKDLIIILVVCIYCKFILISLNFEKSREFEREFSESILDVYL